MTALKPTNTPNTVPRTLTPALLQFCAFISRGEPVFIPSVPVRRAATSFCFENVARRVEEKGGLIAYGWAIWHMPGLYFEAEHHAVGESACCSSLTMAPSTTRSRPGRTSWLRMETQSERGV